MRYYNDEQRMKWAKNIYKARIASGLSIVQAYHICGIKELAGGNWSAMELSGQYINEKRYNKIIDSLTPNTPTNE